MKEVLTLASLGWLAWNVLAPATLVYHGGRVLRRPSEPPRAVIEAEIARAADAFGLGRNVLRALVKVESAFNPKALSPVGARGISQVMPANARRCGLRPDQLWDATFNLRCGAQILREELDQHGDLKKALTVYNCGRVNCTEGKQYAARVLALSTKLL